MKKTIINPKGVIALLLALVMLLGLAGYGTRSAADGNGAPAVIIDTDGSVIEIPSPDGPSNGSTTTSSSWRDWCKPKTETTATTTTMTGKTCKTMTESQARVLKKSLAGGELTTVIRSVSKPTAPDTKNASDDTAYGKVDWSTAAQGYITFTAKGQQREFILEGPNGKKALFTLEKDETIKASLVDGTGKYQYAIANKTADGKAHLVQYKNNFNVAKIDSDLAPYLVSNPWGDYGNAPNAVAKANELWDGNKSQMDNVRAIAKWVKDNINYDKKAKMGTADVYVNPDKVIETGAGVCNEMSKLLSAMLRSQGIPAYVQAGTNARGNAHGWVMAWLELSNETKAGVTYSTGAWVIIEATGGTLQPKAAASNNYVPNEYAN